MKKVLSRKNSEISKQFAENKERIIDEWVRRMKSDIPPARETQRHYLVNSLPVFLDKIVESLRAGSAKLQAAKKVAVEHAEQRVDVTGFSLPQVLKEYKILRQVIFDVLEQNGPVPPAARNTILDLIQTGTIEVATAFCRLSDEILTRSQDDERDLREQFIATLSHDLKTPLASARLPAELLSRKLKDEKDAAAISQILRNIDRADKMIENLLDSNLIRAGKPLPLNVSECDLVSLLKDMVSDLITVYGDRFELIVPKTPVIGHWSAPQLIRCLENLVTNAVKYGRENGPIRISLEAGEEAIITVHNEGRPIEKDQLEQLFKPYSRSVAAGKSGKKGWGLGLTVVKGVVEAHGGEVTVESSKTSGTSFIIELPLDARQSEAVACD